MKVSRVEIEGLLVIQLDLWKDERGFFSEWFQAEKFKDAGLPFHFVQDNRSRSKPGVIRGLHYQQNPWQGKLVGAINGKIWDVAVDIRKGSPTFGKHFSIELSDENGLMLWIPGGFAHGFCVPGDQTADVLYKVDSFYSPKAENGICWSDPELALPWPVKNPVVSEKDQKLQSFHEFRGK